MQVKTKTSDMEQRTAKRIEIQPWITATAEIKTGTNTVWKYLTRSITETIAESLGER